MRMRRVNLQQAFAEMEQANKSPQTWKRWHTLYGQKPARLEFPLGELMNEQIRGFVWAWGLLGKIETAAITKTDRFAAQGIEGKAVIHTTLSGALLAAQRLPRNRVAVYA